MPESIFVGRQPILDRSRRVVAYELLYRDAADATSAVFDGECRAATRVIANTFSSMGADAVLGGCRGFINITEDLLQGDLLRALPPDRIVVELLETVKPSAAVIEACSDLRSHGFTLALDDYVLDDPRHVLLDWVEIVKVDLPAVPRSQLPRLVRQLRRAKSAPQLLAEKVETRKEFEHCHRLGFDLFQGYFFARPVVVSGAAVDPSRAALMKLIGQLEGDADSAALAHQIKSQLQLSVNLLRLVNSAASGRAHSIEKVEDAIVYMGRTQLRRWMMILLYASGDAQGLRSPLLQTAAYRGKMMELAVGLSDDRGARSLQERAFLTGMLSLVDVLLERPLPELLDELGVVPEIRAALLERAGTLGRFVEIVEDVEASRFANMVERSSGLGLDVAALQKADLESHAFVHELISGDF